MLPEILSCGLLYQRNIFCKTGYYFVILLLCSTTLSVCNVVNETDKTFDFDFSNKKNIELYFQIKRKQHLDAVKTLLNFDRYERKFQMLKKIFEKLFMVLHESRQVIDQSVYVVGDPLPLNQTDIVQSTLQIIENCAFFANLVLKLPDISNRLLNENFNKQPNQLNWNDLYKWCFNFTTNSNLLDEISLKMFNLASQQLNLIDRDPDFVNPYEKRKNTLNKSKTTMMKTSKKVTKGPRMSKAEL